MATTATGTTTAIVGALACQKNSFLKTFNTKVVSSYEFIPPQPPKTNKTKQQQQKKDVAVSKEFGVELEDTIFSPKVVVNHMIREPSHYYPITQKSLKLNQF